EVDLDEPRPQVGGDKVASHDARITETRVPVSLLVRRCKPKDVIHCRIAHHAVSARIEVMHHLEVHAHRVYSVESFQHYVFVPKTDHGVRMLEVRQSVGIGGYIKRREARRKISIAHQVAPRVQRKEARKHLAGASSRIELQRYDRAHVWSNRSSCARRITCNL